MTQENVILVNELDEEIGLCEKIKAHKEGLLHRAFSIFVFNENNELLIQKRAFSKYHSGGLWTNTCCSHPKENELTLEAAHRRLQEEMGFDCELKKEFDFVYKASFENGLTEYEFDHVFVGKYNESPTINTNEVIDWTYKSMNEIEEDLQLNPASYTAWFKICYNIFKERLISIN